MQRLLHVRGRRWAKLFHTMPLGASASPGNPGQLGEAEVDLKVEGPAGQHHAYRQGSHVADDLSDRVQPGGVAA